VLAVLLIGGYLYIFRPAEVENKPLILGHGGMGTRSVLPLNSVASVSEALVYDIDGTELDVKMTSDNVLMAFHDSDLMQNTNCNGTIASKSSIVLNNCQQRTWLNTEPIARLDTILSRNWNSNTVFSLDLKPDAGTSEEYRQAYIAELVALIQQHPEFEFFIESQEIELLRQLQTSGLAAEFYFYSNNIKQDTDLAIKNNLDGLSVNLELMDAESAGQIRSANLKLMVWGSGSVFSNRRAIELEPDIIQTDDIASMMKILK
jgi:glycerophosphoryl diester phosphodiesterase